MCFSTQHPVPILRQRASFDVVLGCNVCLHDDGLCVKLVGLKGVLTPVEPDSDASTSDSSRPWRPWRRSKADGGTDNRGGLRLRQVNLQLVVLDQAGHEIYSQVYVDPKLREEAKATFAADPVKRKGGFKVKSGLVDAEYGAEDNAQAARQHVVVERCLKPIDSFLTCRPPLQTNTSGLSLWRDRVACDDEDVQPADRSDNGWAAACTLGWQELRHGGTVAVLQTGPTALRKANGEPQLTAAGEVRVPDSLLVVVHVHAMAFDVIGGVWWSGNEEVVKNWDWLKIEK